MTRAGGERVRVLVVEDSLVTRMLLERIVGDDPRLELVGSVGDGRAALKAVEQLAPDVVSMDIRMPLMDGLEATRRIMESRPTPIVVVSASVEADDLNISMYALKAGALSVVEKPVGVTHSDYQAVADRLCRQLLLMSEVRLVRQRSAGLRRVQAAPPSWPVPVPAGSGEAGAVVGIVASTGGPGALATILGGLGADFPLPCLVVQHMTPNFLEGFVAWLDGTVAMPVRLAVEGIRPEPGGAYVAPAEGHLRLVGGRLRVTAGAAVPGQIPQGTVLLESIARDAGIGSVGVVVTGMGDDGAVGLRALRRAGGRTIAEHASTAVVNGMPAAAVALDAAEEVLPLPRIAPRLLGLAATARVRA